MAYGERHRSAKDMEDWNQVMGYVHAVCGTPARSANLVREEWGCVVCEIVSSHTFHSLPNGKPPLFVTLERYYNQSPFPSRRGKRRMTS